MGDESAGIKRDSADVFGAGGASIIQGQTVAANRQLSTSGWENRWPPTKREAGQIRSIRSLQFLITPMTQDCNETVTGDGAVMAWWRNLGAAFQL
jgi:hypothetical protein